MIIYLDQNKWIELARMFHGKDTSARARQVLKDYECITRVLKLYEEEVERSLLAGSDRFGIKPPAYFDTKHRDNFRKSLATIHERNDDVPKELRENWLYATGMIDILDAINDVRHKHQLHEGVLEELGEDRLKQVMNDMPTRRMDLHLRRQVLRNRKYRARSSDLEDWGGVAVAACYCDVVICEKHMADMLRRDGFETHARVDVALENAFQTVATTNG